MQCNNLLIFTFSIMLHIDTTTGAPAQNTAPTFKVVQQRRGQNVVMVLDKSGSMNTYDVSTDPNFSHEMLET